MNPPMNTGQAAQASVAFSATRTRHDERVGLFPQPVRTDAGCRPYRAKESGTLRFIRHARG
jgi:DNA-binding transcriptional MerR regulator